MTLPAPQDPDFAARVHARFAAQAFMTHLGARIEDVAPGRVVIVLPVTEALAQQHGFVHAGACWSIADSAAGFAAQSLMPLDREVLTVELKINLLRPASGRIVRATGTVRRAGRRLTVCESSVTAHDDASCVAGGREVAFATGTFMAVAPPG
ncbi:MAG: PaaI family thioesterase [Pseudomonadota bacterium]